MSGSIRKSVFYAVLGIIIGYLFNIGLFVGGGALQAEELRCQVCGRSITGTYYRAKGKILCERDYQASRPFCSKCGKAINGTYYDKGNGKYLCEKDYKASLPRCCKCGQIISGKYYEKGNGKYICEKDYKASLPRCCKCGQIISGKYYENENGTYLCEKDYIASCPVCSVCGKKAIGKYTVTGYGHFIACSDCMARKAPKCFLCSLPVIKNGVKYSDGRYACKYHCNDAITTQKQLKPYLRRAWKLIGAYVSPRLKTIPEYLTVHIVDETSLKNAHKKDRDELSMIFGMTHTFPRGDTVMFQIWILQGLPPNELDSTMVHECGHVWLRMHAEGLKGDTPREEGFCEWLSYKVNLGLGREDLAKQIDSRRDKLYGEGFQMYKKIEQKSGINGVLRYALHGK